MWKGINGDIAWTLDAHYYLGCGNRGGEKEKLCIGWMKRKDKMWTNWDGAQIAPTLTMNNAGGEQRMPDKENFNAVTNDVTYVVRRLTPTECARLQGFPDWWCADVPHADSAEYKMWGNGVSLPCVLYVMEGIAKTLKGEK